MKKLPYLMLLIICFSFLFCNKNDDPVSIIDESKVKRKLYFNTIEDSIPKKILNYQYDYKGRLERINYYTRRNPDFIAYYDVFKYSEDNELLTRLTYASTSSAESGYRLNDSTAYTYNNGNLEQEVTVYNLQTDYNDRLLTKYEYDNQYLIQKETLYNDKFSEAIIYEYSGDLRVKESLYKDSLKTEIKYYTIHTYNGELLTHSDVFWVYESSKIQEIDYTYNEKGDILIEESKAIIQFPTFPPVYVIKYEYY